jgi:hypothetical protein
MKTHVLSALCLILSTTIPTRSVTADATPTIAPKVPFAVPLTTGQAGQALLLPIDDKQAYLVYSAPTGQIGFYRLTSDLTPPVTPPTPTPAVAAVITITESTAAELPAAVAQRLTAISATYHSFTVAMVADDAPPENALLWIGRSAGKPYPYTFIVRGDGTIQWEGPTPQTDAAFLALLDKPTTTPAAARCCPTGTCPQSPILSRKAHR